ncbi:hypothetical protein DNTS_015064 [Danionella cerebrum]|uniref:Uncharacterized protein n=1 Tax=Danionella cerebrum TaxID=2873325 RepID=A0A553Q0B6_9TELE|nr:hypothetical protein DNTS_015064 [Danionella translucida]TRY83336.1 hypothetical protein DNTS_015064 [Danionella translucida]
MNESRSRSHDQVQDEFTCAGVLRGALEALQPCVERVFAVKLIIGEEETDMRESGQIWLQLRGATGDVRDAKGVVNQEAQQLVQFPDVFRCVFSGARGLFMDCLIKNTSAHIVVGSPDLLLISGLAESVVKAYSFITDLVEMFSNGQKRSSEPSYEAMRESLDSRRAFKSLVEKLEDRYTLDLLVLPQFVKEVLLGLVKESGLDCEKWYEALEMEKYGANNKSINVNSQSPLRAVNYNPINSETLQIGQNQVPNYEPLLRNGVTHSSPSLQPTMSRSQLQPSLEMLEREPKSEMKPPERPTNKTNQARPEQALSMFRARADNERGFTPSNTMEDSRNNLFLTEYSEQSSPTGPESGRSRLLVQNGSGDDFKHLLKFFTDMGFSETAVCNVLTKTGLKEASELLDVIQQEQDRADHNISPGAAIRQANQSAGARAKEEDFVLRVQKQAAASCGYTEERVMEVYRNKPELPPHKLLLHLQKHGEEQPIGTINDAKLDNLAIKPNSPSDGVKDEAVSRKEAPVITKAQGPLVKGPPQMAYSTETLNSESQMSWVQRIRQTSGDSGSSNASAQVTGSQRFLEGLRTPFRLQLADEPGDPELRHIIIDGSNVAMSHGLGVFFSCRGVALAVQHFWGRGHRKIVVFIPQWRQKSSQKVKERQYLTELHELGLLSYTPSREVDGRRISSYDDRFMLDMAEQTHGVIVTNDNLRDLVDESPAWRDIIKSSLLQYVFAGDLFMLPDDPLGRGGPHLRDFLHQNNRYSTPGGQRSHRVQQSSLVPSEVMLDWMPGGKGRAGFEGSDGGQGPAWGRQSPGDQRSTEETLRLRRSLEDIFPDQKSIIIMVLQCHPDLRDLSRLTELILEELE